MEPSALRVGRYVFRCRLEDRAVLPRYKGSTFRGVLGHSLRRTVCALKTRECSECLLKSRCLYARIFENSAPPSGGRGAPTPPPYLIEPPMNMDTDLDRGSAFDFDLLLFGEFNDAFPYFLYAFSDVGSVGIGKRIDGQRAGYRVLAVSHENETIFEDSTQELRCDQFGTEIRVNPDGIENAPLKAVRVHFETPLRTKYENRLKADMPFHVLIRGVLRRISSLFSIYGDGEPAYDYKGLVAGAHDIHLKENGIRWFDWKRYSNRQDKSMLMGGILGSAVYEGDMGGYMPLLRLAETFHVGKQTTFGLGRIRVEALE